MPTSCVFLSNLMSNETTPFPSPRETYETVDAWLGDDSASLPSAARKWSLVEELEELLGRLRVRVTQVYGIPHESFTWGVRSEPGVIAVFEKLSHTEDLLVSFDAVNVSLPNRRDLPPVKPWAHQDQDPLRPGFRCIQGFVNLNPYGDNDGGLVVLKGDHLVSKEYHEAFKNEEQEFRWTNEMYLFKETGLKWLEEKGLEWVKVNCGPGDLVLWDFRAPHYNVAPSGDMARFVVYNAYAPVSTATKEDLLQKKWLFENTKGHSHWPQGFQPFVEQFIAPKRNGELDPHNNWTPRRKPVLSERAYKLTGIPYLEAMS
ncbi:hypothetical protein JCM10296v2_004837 [Rhodotorula toruloides]